MSLTEWLVLEKEIYMSYCVQLMQSKHSMAHLQLTNQQNVW